MTPAAQIPAPTPPPSTPKVERPLDQAIAMARRWWRPVVFGLLGVQLLLVVFDRLHLPFGVEFGSRSFARNVAIFAILGILAGARGLPRVRSQVLLPLLLFLAAAALSVAFAGTKWGDFNSLLAMVGLFIGARSIASDADGRRWIFHWLGVLTATTVFLEIVQNPSILQLREELRGTTVTAHPNTLGVFFALLGPIFVARTFDAEDRGAAFFYTACALLGASFTFSRLAWSALVLGTLVIVFAGRPLRRRAALASGVLGATVVGGAIAYLSLGRSEADWQRLRIIYTSLTLFLEHWLVGIGFGTGNLAQLFPARYIELYGSSLFLFHSHNMYVDILVGTGVLGAMAMGFVLWRLVGVARRCLEAARQKPALRLPAAGFAASVLVFLYVGVGDMPWYHSKILLPLAMVWGLMEGWAAWAEASADPIRVQGRESGLEVRTGIG